MEVRPIITIPVEAETHQPPEFWKGDSLVCKAVSDSWDSLIFLEKYNEH